MSVPSVCWIHLLSLTVMLMVGVPSSASELVVRNLYVDVEFLPTDIDYELDDGTSRSGSDELDTGFGIAVGARYSFARTGDAHGFMLGLQGVVAQAGFADSGHLTDYGLRVEGGYGIALNDSWSVNVLSRVGYGWSTFDFGGNAVLPSVSLSGTALSYGAALGVDWTINDNWQISTSLGYLWMNYDLSGNGVDLTLERSGMSATIGFLYRLSHLPRPLE